MSGLQNSGFEFADVGIEGGGFEGPDQRFARVGGIDDGVDPEAGGGVARIGLVFVSGADGFDQFFLLFFVYFFAFAFELPSVLFSARVLAAASPLMTAKRAVGHANMKRGRRLCRTWRNFRLRSCRRKLRYFWNYAIRHRVYHFRACADDAAPFRVFADHKAVHVVQENQWNSVLVAIENEARGFFRGLGINHAAKFDALLVGAARQRLHVFLLIRDNADGPAADARISAEQCLAILNARYSSNSLASRCAR